MNRVAALQRIGSETAPWDVVVIGGGATGLGTALDAAARGYRTLLLEQADFAKATSSRSTKLSHGGVRYLQQGNLSLVLEALRERGRMLRNAPHLVRKQPFVIPAYAAWQIPFYGVGLKIYDALSGKSSFGRSEMLSGSTARELLPTVVSDGLSGGVLYFDGQFDDARYAIALTRTLDSLGGTALNYARVTGLKKRNGVVEAVTVQDEESGNEAEINCRVVINATGVFTDAVRNMDEPQSAPMLTLSQGTHFVLPKSFLPGRHALMVPRTADGRVLFAIPWHGAVVVGTTDEPVPASSLEPRAIEVETAFLREHIQRYFGRAPQDEEVLSMWSGLRPLIRHQGTTKTAALSREHTILVAPSRLVTVTGGKWTTYRRMAEDTVNTAAKVAGLPERPCVTQDLHLHGWSEKALVENDSAQDLSIYGSDTGALNALAASGTTLHEPLHERLPYRKADVLWAARFEMALTVEDVLARRTRALFLDARAAIQAAPAVAQIMAQELHRDAAWEQQQVANFTQLAQGYLYRS